MRIKYIKVGKFNIIKEVSEKTKPTLIFCFLFFCEYFETYELGGIYSFAHGMKEYFMHFVYLKLINNPKSIDLDIKNTFIYFSDYSIHISLKVSNSNIFQRYLNKYLENESDHEIIIYNICLIEPQILFNIKTNEQTNPNAMDFDWTFNLKEAPQQIFSKNIEKISKIISNLIKDPEKIFDSICSKIHDDLSFQEKYKTLIKPLFLLVLKLTQFSFCIQKKPSYLFVKMIMDIF